MRRREAVRVVVLVLLCPLLVVGLLHTLRPAAPPAGAAAVGGLLMDDGAGGWTATLPGEGRRAPAEYARSSRGCGPLFRWAIREHAVARGTVKVGYTVGAAAGSSTLMRRIRLVKGEAVDPPKGDDIGCVGVAPDEQKQHLGSENGAGPLGQPQFSLDGGRSEQTVTYPVRSGGTVSGIVAVSTRACSCTWWLEVDVEEDGRQRTLRIDDAGRPFRSAPLTSALATNAERGFRYWNGRPLARSWGDPGPAPGGLSASVRVEQSVPVAGAGWRANTEGPADPADVPVRNLHIGGTACRQMGESLLEAGAVPAGELALGLHISAPPDVFDATLDASVRVEKVEPATQDTHQYSCVERGANLDDAASADLVHDRSLYPDTLHAMGPFPSGSLKYDPDWDAVDGEGKEMPLAVGEEVYLSEDETGANGLLVTAGLFVEAATFHLTVDVTITLPSGQRHRFELTDHGKPFVVGPGPGKLPALHRVDHRETGGRPADMGPYDGDVRPTGEAGATP